MKIRNALASFVGAVRRLFARSVPVLAAVVAPDSVTTPALIDTPHTEQRPIRRPVVAPDSYRARLFTRCELFGRHKGRKARRYVSA